MIKNDNILAFFYFISIVVKSMRWFFFFLKCYLFENTLK